MGRRVRRLFRGGRVLDLGGGHGLLAQIMLLLDDSSPTALVIDKALPASTAKLHNVLVESWPRLSARIRFVTCTMDDVEILDTDIVVSCHACGAITDRVLDRAVGARARVAVLPCCHDLDSGDDGGLSGWVNGAAAIDIVRARRLAERGYRIWTQAIPEAITPKNRLLLGAPAAEFQHAPDTHKYAPRDHRARPAHSAQKTADWPQADRQSDPQVGGRRWWTAP